MCDGHLYMSLENQIGFLNGFYLKKDFYLPLVVTATRLRPLALLRAKTSRPSLVSILLRKPCTFFRRLRLGCSVLFILRPQQTIITSLSGVSYLQGIKTHIGAPGQEDVNKLNPYKLHDKRLKPS